MDYNDGCNMEINAYDEYILGTIGRSMHDYVEMAKNGHHHELDWPVIMRYVEVDPLTGEMNFRFDLAMSFFMGYYANDIVTGEAFSREMQESLQKFYVKIQDYGPYEAEMLQNILMFGLEQKEILWEKIKHMNDFVYLRFETEHLILKKARFEDWKPLYDNITSHKESARYMLWTPTKNEEEAKDQIVRTMNFERSCKYSFLIFLKEINEPIGYCAMRECGEDAYEELGIAIGPAFVRKGYGTEVLNLLTEEAKKQGAKRFLASNWEKNIASKELQRACGFVFDHLSEEKTDPRNGEKYYVENNVKYL